MTIFLNDLDGTDGFSLTTNLPGGGASTQAVTGS